MAQHLFCACGQCEQPLQIHLFTLCFLGIDFLLQVCKEKVIFALLKGLCIAGGAVADSVIATAAFAIGKQHGQRAP